ncbi:hypothetical protein EJB05_02186, partial [Eragrostis curvula]
MYGCALSLMDQVGCKYECGCMLSLWFSANHQGWTKYLDLRSLDDWIGPPLHHPFCLPADLNTHSGDA